jgi:flavin-dependent dehydrogenase
MSELYDVIVSGGGYAGLCCALRLKNRKVLLLESRREIGRKHRGCQCGLYAFGETFDLKGTDLHFHNNNFTVRDAIVAKLSRVELVSGGRRLVVSIENPMALIDEGKMKGAMENMCRDAGVEIVTGAPVTSVETDGQKVSVFAGKKYDGRFLVGADGARSRVVQKLPIKRRQMGSLRELEVEAKRANVPEESMYGEMRNVKVGFYAQPYDKGYLLGAFQALGMKEKPIDLKAYMREIFDKLKVEGVTRQYGCSMPLYWSASSSYHENVVLAGDAVSSCSVTTIAGAMMMGLLAGEAVEKKMEGHEDAFKDYDKKWRKVLQQGSMDGMRYIFFLLKRLNEKRMARLFGALEGKDLGLVGAGYYLKRIPGIVRAFF